MVRQLKTYLFLACVCLAFSAVFLFTSCSGRGDMLKDGYYTAEALNFDDYGWKEFISIYVSDNKIITVDYDAKNASGLLKSWDISYMRDMDAISGTYPNEYTRLYSDMFLEKQSSDGIDVIAGATHSYHVFYALVDAVIDNAKDGEKSIAYVDFN
jgi:Major membrane immunogen, membrane-anchored lipoprotein